MMLLRKIILFWSLSCLIGINTANAQALPVPAANFVINRAEAAIFTRVAIARGFAANDPRIASTLTAMSEASTAVNVASTGASLALGFAGAPVWLTVAAGLGIVAAGGFLSSGGFTLSLSPDAKTVTAQQPLASLPAYTGPAYQSTPPAAGLMQRPFDYGVSLGMQVYRTDQCLATDSTCAPYPQMPATGLNFVRNFQTLVLVAATIGAVQAYDLYEQQYNCNAGSLSGHSFLCGGVQSVSVFWQSNANVTTQTLMETRAISQWDAQTGQYVLSAGTQPVTWWTAGSGVKPIVGPDLSSVYPQLTNSTLNTKLDPLVLANLVNNAWLRAASQPSYQGLPYSVTSPVTYADVQPWELANPSLAPNIGDLFTPAADPGANVAIDPAVQPGQSTTPDTGASGSTGTTPSTNVSVVNTPNVNVVNKVSVDLGPDPDVQSPALEATPTISMILSPVLNLLPDLKGWAVPGHGAQCPEPSFTAFGQSYTITAQCDLAEANRTAIYTSFAAMFSLAALFIVLRA